MSDFLIRLKAGLQACEGPGPRLGVAVSGGADSMALLHGLSTIAQPERLDLRVLHVNHQLRGAESDADEEFVRQEALRLGLPVAVRSIDVRELAERRRLGIEEAARAVRYEWFAEVANAEHLQAIATAHHRDDRVETVLHHLIRGTGLQGLQGIPRRRVVNDSLVLVRPLLDVSRQDIDAYLTQVHQEYRTDSTNLDATFTRNRLRSQLLPLLEEEFNPNVRDAVIRLSNQAAEVQHTLDHMVEGILRRAVQSRDSGVIELKRRRLAELPDHAVRECFRALWIQQSWPRQSLGHAHLSTLCRLTREDGAASLPEGVHVSTRGSVLRLVRGT